MFGRRNIRNSVSTATSFSLGALSLAANLFFACAQRVGAQTTVSPKLSMVAPTPAKASGFEIKGGQFQLDGKPFQIISGEMHYPRIPVEYWRQRLKMAKACGLNTITTYVFWNMHEPQKGKFDFRGGNDIARFIKIAQQEGLFVILRPGPYVCAEWDFGGYPYWLLNEKGITIRTREPKYMALAQNYLNMLGKQLAPLQVDHGGNILMVQIENEYGSYGNDKVYIGMCRDAVTKAGFTVPLFMCDGGSQLASDYVAGLFPGENGGSGPDVKKTIDKYYPGGPYFVPEYYPGWLDHWGAPMVRVGTTSVVRSTERMLDSGMSFNYYMFHGGTNFGFLNGANFGSGFEPDITSYDYDAPLDEAGRATPKYMAIREAIQKRIAVGAESDYKLPAVPKKVETISIPAVELSTSSSLMSTLPPHISSEQIRSMESLKQDYGYILYRTTIHGPVDALLTIKDVRDYAVIMVNGKRIATVDRRRKSAKPHIVITSAGDSQLDILVENGGRINYGPLLLDNLKGITESVRLGETLLTGWQIYSLPMVGNDISRLKSSEPAGDSPIFHSGSFQLDHVADTYLDMRGWTKGVAFINGHNLGRFWEVGPQQTLYVPAPWLQKGDNKVVIFDLLPNGKNSVAFLSEPVLDDVHKDVLTTVKRPVPSAVPVPTANQMVTSGEFTQADSPQDKMFASQSGRYVCFQAIDSFDGDYASCAELYLLDSNGKPLNRDKWKIYYADSEELAQEDGSAENMIDDDTATIWHSVWSEKHGPFPHMVVIDLGAESSFSGVRYVGRKGEKPAKTRKFAIYVSKSPFVGAGSR